MDQMKMRMRKYNYGSTQMNADGNTRKARVIFHLCLSVFFCGSFLFSCSKEAGSAASVAQRAASDWPVFRGDAALTGNTAERLPDRLTLAFTLKAGESVTSSPVIARGRLFVASTDGLVTAWDLVSRQKLWSFALADGFEASPLVLPDRGLVVVGGMDGVVYALDADSGKARWRGETGAQIMGSVNIFPAAAGQARILAGSYDHSFYAFNIDSGKREWSFETGNYLNGTAAVADGLAAIGGCDAQLHVFDLEAGRQTGAVDTGAYIAGAAALADNIAYVGNYAGRFLAIDVRRLITVWSFALADESRGFASSPAVTEKYIVIGARDKQLYCLDRATGKPVWKYRAGDEYESSPLSGGDRVLAVAADGEAAVVELATGRIVSAYRIGARVKGSPAFAAGYLAVAALDGNVYVFKGD
jgi:eukaryotic-like serine/threonine-protein kinase